MSSSRRRIYLDHNATAPLLDCARTALLSALDVVGNPSSVHAEGRQARATVETARRSVADLVGAEPENVVFTGSATEAAATCLTPRWVRDGEAIDVRALAVLDTDHPAIRDGGQFSTDAVSRLSVDADGRLRLASLDAWLARLGGASAMLALCLANGETGVIQSLDAVRERLADRDVLLVVDAVQAAGRLPLDVAALETDALILSGHKIGTAKGVGAFVLRSDRLRPFRLIPGGGQEKGVRSGTEAVPAIASFGAAARVARERARTGLPELRRLRERVVETLRGAGCSFVVLGGAAERIDNTLAISVPGLRAETAQIALDLEGFAVSVGSACSSGKLERNHVLAAMSDGGLDVDPASGLVRVSMGEQTSELDIEAFATVFARIILRSQQRTGTLQAA